MSMRLEPLSAEEIVIISSMVKRGYSLVVFSHYFMPWVKGELCITSLHGTKSYMTVPHATIKSLYRKGILMRTKKRCDIIQWKIDYERVAQYSSLNEITAQVALGTVPK